MGQALEALDAASWFVEDCLHCHALFAMPRSANDRYRKTHESFFCPYCKGSMCYPSKSDEERLRDENNNLKQLLEWRANALEAANKIAAVRERQRRAHKAQATRLRKKIAAGSCPCCSTVFADLRQHMLSKHPTFAKASGIMKNSKV